MEARRIFFRRTEDMSKYIKGTSCGEAADFQNSLYLPQSGNYF